MDTSNQSGSQPSAPPQGYGAYRVSEYTHQGQGRGYKVDESQGVPAREDAL